MYPYDSALDPLEESLVVTSDAKQPVSEVASSESGSDNVLGVASKTHWLATFSARVSEELDKSIIVTGSDQRLVFVEVNSVDMSSVCALWEDSVDQPSELAVTSSPVGTSGIGSARRILVARWNHEV